MRTSNIRRVLSLLSLLCVFVYVFIVKPTVLPIIKVIFHIRVVVGQ
jgi:hypothetical protein